MGWIDLLVAVALLPVFPGSLVFNLLISRAPTWWGKAVAMVLLPEAGVGLLAAVPNNRLPLVHSRGWIVLVVLSAVFYAFRAVSVREISIWARLMATSGLGLVWVLEDLHRKSISMEIAVLAWSVPAGLLLILAGLLTERTGGAYLGLQGGLATVAPRLSGLLSLSVLALVATPLFPSFFALLHVLSLVQLYWLGPLLVLLLVWGWAAGSFLQQLLFSSYRGERFPDISMAGTSSVAFVLSLLVVFAVIWSGLWLRI